MLKAKRPNRNESTREEVADALLRRIGAYTIVLERHLKGDDYKRMKTLRPFLKTADRLMTEIGYQDDY
jgi:hypothetical protein